MGKNRFKKLKRASSKKNRYHKKRKIHAKPIQKTKNRKKNKHKKLHPKQSKLNKTNNSQKPKKTNLSKKKAKRKSGKVKKLKKSNQKINQNEAQVETQGYEEQNDATFTNTDTEVTDQKLQPIAGSSKRPTKNADEEPRFFQSGLMAKSDAWEGELDVLAFEGEEQISGLYEYRIKVEHNDLISDTGAAIQIKGMIDQTEVYIHGYITKIDAQYIKQQLLLHITIRTPLEKLKFQGRNRVFESKSYLDIIAGILYENGILYEDYSGMSFEEVEYVVQYQQSDLDFLLSIFKTAGLQFAFIHNEQNVTLIFFTTIDQLELKLNDSLLYDYTQDSEDRYIVSKCNVQAETTFNGYYGYDYDFTAANQTETFTSRESTKPQQLLQLNNSFTNGSVSENQLEAAINNAQNNKKLMQLTTKQFVSLGMFFNLIIWGQEYGLYVVRIKYKLEAEYGIAKYTFNSHITSIQDDSQAIFLPKVNMKKIANIQLGIVLGEQPNTTNTDQWGRVRVRFMWDDKYLNLNDQSSDDLTNACWVRVAMSGMSSMSKFYVPRVGEEVMVVFENGDPCRPLIVGCMPNSNNFPDHDPVEEEVSYWKMTKTGNEKEINKIAIDANPKSSLISVDACQDMSMDIRNNFTHTITKGLFDFTNKEGDHNSLLKKGDMTTKLEKGNMSETLILGNKKTILNKGNETLLIKKGDKKEELQKGNETLLIKKGNQKLDIKKGNRQVKVNGKQVVDIAKNSTLKVGKNHNLRVRGNNNNTIKKSRNTTINASDKLTIKTGNYTIKVQAGKLTINAGREILEKAPKIVLRALGNLTLHGGSVNIKADSAIKLDAPTVTCNAGAALTAKSGGMTKVEGSMVSVKGGLIKLN